MNAFSTPRIRAAVFPLLALGLGSLCSSAVLAEPLPPLTIQQVAGGGQIAPSNRIFARPLVARVTDAAGTPVAGVEVHFTAPHCLYGGAICFVPSAYPYFPFHAVDVTAVTDSDGLATSPSIQAGDESAFAEPPPTTSTWEFTATVQNDVPTAFAAESTAFLIFQTEALHTVPITSGFTGTWYDPEQNGHGLTVEVLPDNRVLVTWNTFTPDGSQQAWFGGAGEIVGQQAIIYASRAEGGRWIPYFDSSQVSVRLWGTLTLTFSDCNHGRVLFAGDGGFGNGSIWRFGEMDLTRLTLPAGLSCP
ncbi:MAG TPA: Ig-like domain-containing protein [Dokdonella sp.]|nr:Ig-like domain-containing protein [Dokdonella sp.]